MKRTESFSQVAEEFRLVAEFLRLLTESFRLLTESFRLAIELFRLLTESFRLTIELFRLLTESFRLAIELFHLPTESFRLATELLSRSTESLKTHKIIENQLFFDKNGFSVSQQLHSSEGHEGLLRRVLRDIRWLLFSELVCRRQGSCANESLKLIASIDAASPAEKRDEAAFTFWVSVVSGVPT